MKPSNKQQAVLNFLYGEKAMSKKEIMIGLMVQYWYYCNAEKHFGELLSRMVKSGFIERERKGYYKLKSSTRIKAVDEKQLNIF